MRWLLVLLVFVSCDPRGTRSPASAWSFDASTDIASTPHDASPSDLISDTDMASHDMPDCFGCPCCCERVWDSKFHVDGWMGDLPPQNVAACKMCRMDSSKYPCEGIQ